MSGPLLRPPPSAERPRARRAAPAWRWREPPPRAPGGHGGRRAGATQVRAGNSIGGRGRGGAPEWSEAGGPPHRRSRQAATTMTAAMASAHEVAQPRRPQRAAWPRWAAAARGGRKRRPAKVAPPLRPAALTRAGRRRALLCSAPSPPLSLSLSESLPLFLGCHISATWRLTAENRRHISVKSPKPASGYKLTGL